jgi:hypothetical protein
VGQQIKIYKIGFRSAEIFVFFEVQIGHFLKSFGEFIFAFKVSLFLFGNTNKISKDSFRTFSEVSPEDFDKHVIFLLGTMIVNIGMKNGLIGEGRVPNETFDVGEDLLINEFFGELML